MGTASTHPTCSPLKAALNRYYTPREIDFFLLPMLHNLYIKLKENCEIFQAISKNSPQTTMQENCRCRGILIFFEGLHILGTLCLCSSIHYYQFIHMKFFFIVTVWGCCSINSNRCQGALDQKMKTWQQFLQFSSFNSRKICGVALCICIKNVKNVVLPFSQACYTSITKDGFWQRFWPRLCLNDKTQKECHHIYVKSVGLTS